MPLAKWRAALATLLQTYFSWLCIDCCPSPEPVCLWVGLDWRWLPMQPVRTLGGLDWWPGQRIRTKGEVFMWLSVWNTQPSPGRSPTFFLGKVWTSWLARMPSSHHGGRDFLVLASGQWSWREALHIRPAPAPLGASGEGLCSHLDTRPAVAGRGWAC